MDRDIYQKEREHGVLYLKTLYIRKIMKFSTIKKFIKNPTLFFNSLISSGVLNKMDDERYLKLKWRFSMGGKLNLNTPKTFNEKIQWLKLYDRKEYYPSLVDKYEAKLWVANIIGEQHIIRTLGVWNSFEDIDFDMLPNQFVLKCTHDSGGLIICRDKNQFNFNNAKKIINASLSRNYFYGGREWPYKNIKPRIIAEEFMSDSRTEETGLTDFKFFCFNGTPQFLYISQGLENHDTAGISFFDFEGKKLAFKRSDYKSIDGDHFELPVRFDEMLTMARKLAIQVNCPFVRVDLYEIKGEVYFSEITFSPCSGFMPLEPKEADLYLGNMIDLSGIL